MHRPRATSFCLATLAAAALATHPALGDEPTMNAGDQPTMSRDDGLPRNIILFIGDGMGASQITAARIAQGELSLERLPVGGLIATHAANALVTDSAASGTALATGHKTQNGVVSLSAEGELVPTVAEIAEREGLATGTVVTCSVTHATPAVFFAHTESRQNHTVIADQIVESGIDVLVGGGWSYFVPASEDESRRKDERNLLAELGERMPVVRSVEEFRALGDVDAATGLFAPRHPAGVEKRGYSLAEMTERAIEILARDDDGFFLMVEGSQIDWAGHDSDLAGIIAEMRDFDEAVGAGLDFAEADGRTLVVVTADHETGGFAVHAGSIDDRKVTEAAFTSAGHTATMVPIFAYGPGSVAFGGIHDNTFVGTTLISYVEH